MATFFRAAPGVRTTGRKKVREAMRQAGGLLPFPRTGCVLYAMVDCTGVGGRGVKRGECSASFSERL